LHFSASPGDRALSCADCGLDFLEARQEKDDLHNCSAIGVAARHHSPMWVNHGHSASGNHKGQCRQDNDLLHGWLPSSGAPSPCRGLDGDAVIQKYPTQGSAKAPKGLALSPLSLGSRLSASGRDGSPPGGRPDSLADRRPHSHSLERRCCNTHCHKLRSRRRQRLFRKLRGDKPFGGRLQRSRALAVVLLGHQHCQWIASQSFATIEARRAPQPTTLLQR
jgi:hypothetical protein